MIKLFITGRIFDMEQIFKIHYDEDLKMVNKILMEGGKVKMIETSSDSHFSGINAYVVIEMPENNDYI